MSERSLRDVCEGVELISQGAEARIYKMVFLGKPTIVKERFVKKYRHSQLDNKINQQRILAESRTLLRARTVGIDTPIVYHVDKANKRIFMELIEGKTVKQHIFQNPDFNSEVIVSLAKKIGRCIGKFHASDYIHGDLTTSNMMIRDSNQNLVLLDFGLSFVSTLAEDKAVDLYVLERAFLSTHPNSEQMFESILKEYGQCSKDAVQVLTRLETVRQRGRKKLAFG